MKWTAICQQLHWLRHSRIHPRSTDVRIGPYFIDGVWEVLAVRWN